VSIHRHELLAAFFIVHAVIVRRRCKRISREGCSLQLAQTNIALWHEEDKARVSGRRTSWARPRRHAGSTTAKRPHRNASTMRAGAERPSRSGPPMAEKPSVGWDKLSIAETE